MKITLAQLNPTIGDFVGNFKKIKKTLQKAKKEKSDLIIFPELFITGYPPRDLLEKEKFIKKANSISKKIANSSRLYPQMGILFGNVTLLNSQLYNSAILAYQGKIIFRQFKSCLPKQDVFDEPRYFKPSPGVKIFQFKGEKLGISICADIWTKTKQDAEKCSFFPIKKLASQKASLFINLSASPFYVGKEKIRLNLLKTQALRYKTPIIYINQVGGNDELIFDGRSMVVNSKGKLVNVLSSFKEDVKTIDTAKFNKSIIFKPSKEIKNIYQALILGLKDYSRKCGFKKAIIGLSGGIDSSVTCSLAYQALGKKNVIGVSMPSPYSSKTSIIDAQNLAKNLGIDLKIIPITQIYKAYSSSLKKYLGKKMIIAYENIQARIRGNILMALSNKYSYLVLSTGNKSELAIGYCTLYGDMTGGLSVISDLSKHKVYELARYINKKKEIIPQRIIEKPPSPELRPKQLTEKDLIPYNILDPIIKFVIEDKLSLKEIVKKGFNKKIVQWVMKKISKNEFKRRQAAPGLRITRKAFGIGRRMPVAAKYDFEN